MAPGRAQSSINWERTVISLSFWLRASGSCILFLNAAITLGSGIFLRIDALLAFPWCASRISALEFRETDRRSWWDRAWPFLLFSMLTSKSLSSNSSGEWSRRYDRAVSEHITTWHCIRENTDIRWRNGAWCNPCNFQYWSSSTSTQ